MSVLLFEIYFELIIHTVRTHLYIDIEVYLSFLGPQQQNMYDTRHQKLTWTMNDHRCSQDTKKFVNLKES